LLVGTAVGRGNTGLAVLTDGGAVGSVEGAKVGAGGAVGSGAVGNGGVADTEGSLVGVGVTTVLEEPESAGTGTKRTPTS